MPVNPQSFKYYKHAGLGVVGASLAHEEGEHTMLLGHTRNYSWIRTADLYNTREEAEAAPVATFAEQSDGQ